MGWGDQGGGAHYDELGDIAGAGPNAAITEASIGTAEWPCDGEAVVSLLRMRRPTQASVE